MSQSPKSTRKKATKKVAADSSSDHRSSYSDRAYKIAELAVQIMGLVPRKPRDPALLNSGFDLDEDFWNAEFEAARYRAEVLLDDIEQDLGTVDAFQLFEEGIVLSCEEIFATFKEANWKGLASMTPTRKLMRRLELSMQRYNAELVRLIPANTDELAEEVLNTLDDIGSWEGVRKVFPGFMEHLNRFISSMHRESIRLTEEEAFHELFWLEAFSKWCIVREKVGGKPVIKYRAHDLFRFAKTKHWESDSLTKPKTSVTGRVYPKASARRMSRFEKFNKERESFLSLPDPIPLNDSQARLRDEQISAEADESKDSKK